jgi:hypothetical protein
MAMVIGIMGESGAGKTTSMRNLDPKTTFYCDCDKKGLSWKDWRKQYSFENGNYMKTDVPATVLNVLKHINEDEKQKHVKTVIIDTINGMMVADEMRRMKEKGYDKWQDLATSIYFLFDYALEMRDDVTVIFVAHTQTDVNESGYMWTRIKTSGKKLDKITIESKLPTVLYAKCVDGKYIFETQSNFSTAKSPMGALEKEEPNDIKVILEKLEGY